MSNPEDRKAMVFLLDARENVVSIVEHNLLLFDALYEVMCLRGKGVQAYYALQKYEHYQPEPENCSHCLKSLAGIATLGVPPSA